MLSRIGLRTPLRILPRAFDSRGGDPYYGLAFSCPRSVAVAMPPCLGVTPVMEGVAGVNPVRSLVSALPTYTVFVLKVEDGS
jgi:hypothetical protein